MLFISKTGISFRCLRRLWKYSFSNMNDKCGETSISAVLTASVALNCVSCFNASHIFVDIFIIIHRAVIKFGMKVQAKHINVL